MTKFQELDSTFVELDKEESLEVIGGGSGWATFWGGLSNIADALSKLEPRGL